MKKIKGDLIIEKGNTIDYSKLIEVSGNIYLREGATLDAPLLATSGSIYLSKDATLDAPLLATSGDIDLSKGATLDAPSLATSGDIDLREGATLAAPLLATLGSIYLSKDATLDAPMLATAGSIYLSEGATLDANIFKKINHKSVDGRLFIIESEKSTNGIKIYSGWNFVSMIKKAIKKEICFVAEKGDFTAHGETVKKAISDLQFKIIAEKLKKDPIKKDTVIDVNYYRTVTGACEFGVRSFIDSHKLKKSYKASELLPILEKNNAWGLEKIKSLITF